MSSDCHEVVRVQWWVSLLGGVTALGHDDVEEERPTGGGHDVRQALSPRHGNVVYADDQIPDLWSNNMHTCTKGKGQGH